MEELDLVLRMQIYSNAKPAVSASITFGEQRPSYHLLGDFLRSIATFYLDVQPAFVRLRCSQATLDQLQNSLPLRLAKDMKWGGKQWVFADLTLDDSLNETQITALIDESYRVCFEELSTKEKQLVYILQRNSSGLSKLDQLVQLHELQHRHVEIEALIQPSIWMQTLPTNGDDLVLGQSKLGGYPDLPIGLEFPRFDGRPLPFLAQVNLSDIPDDIKKAPLPDKGILYFFSGYGWEGEDFNWYDLGFERTSEQGFSQVLYTDGETQLRRINDVDGLTTYKCAAVKFAQLLSLPEASKYARDPILTGYDWTEEEFERLSNLESDFAAGRNRTRRTPNHTLLGYANPIQSAPTTAETRILCQIDSDYHSRDTDMSWGDGGIIYFMIAHGDLETGNFSNILSDMQCS